MKFLIVNITWLPNKWKGIPSTEAEKVEIKKISGFRYVKENVPHECFNFSELTIFNGYKYGFAQFTLPPQYKNFDIIFFHSSNKLVGVYHSAEIIDSKTETVQGMEIGFNIRCPENDWILFDEFVELDKEHHLIKEGEVKNRIGQVGYNYIDANAAKNILENAKSISKDNQIREKIEQLEKAIFNTNPVQRFWKVSPGEGGKCWEECQKKGVIGIGKIQKKDVHGLTEEEVKEYLYEERGKRSPSLIKFIFQITKGHIIIAYSSPSTIYGVGIVEEKDWKYNENIPYEYSCLINTRKVNWIKPFSPIKVEDDEIKSKLGIREAISEIPKDFFINKLLPLFPDTFRIESFLIDTEIIESYILKLISKKHQIILYGPPGTGKTYNARKLALEFLRRDNYSVRNSMKEVK
ncbi:hypothetical protein METP3_02247 [Methanosarcinales archaeon]|nr:hypothetical protein METP3_02247 [Methanosarcinales archaeon]